MEQHIAAATFRLCGEAGEENGPSVVFDFYEDQKPEEAEIELLKFVGEDGNTNFVAFHEERESCCWRRPLSDLLNIWHPDKIEGSTFCLHLYARELSPDQDESVLMADADLAQDDDDIASNIDVAQPSPIRRVASIVPESTVNIRLSFVVADSVPLRSRNKTWAAIRTFSVPLSTRVVDLPKVLAPRVNERASSQSKLLPTLQEQRRQLLCTPSFRFGDTRDLYYRFCGREVRVNILNDLFSTQLTSDETVPVDVNIQADDVITAPQSVADAVAWGEWKSYRLYRLGTIPRKKPDRDENIDVPIETALVACFGAGDKLRLLSMPVWQLNDLSIGGSQDELPAIFDGSYRWMGQYEGVRSLEELDWRVRAERRRADTTPDDILPVSPSYSFQQFVPEDEALFLDEWPEAGVYLALHFVDLLTTRGERMTFPAPESTQFGVEMTDTPASIREVLMEMLQETKGIRSSAELLFDADVRESWKMDLWILPQVEGGTTMYQWRGGSLTQFLHAEKGQTDARLYVEAHIVPRAGGAPTFDITPIWQSVE